MRTCETCKHHDKPTGACQFWRVTRDFRIVAAGSAEKVYHFETPKGFGCPSHEEREVATQDRQQALYRLITVAQELEGLPPDYSGDEKEWLKKFADAGRLAEQLLKQEREDGQA